MEETPSNNNNNQETLVPTETPATNPAGSGDPSITSSVTKVEIATPDQSDAVAGKVALAEKVSLAGNFAVAGETSGAAEPPAKRQRGRPPGSKNKPKAPPLVHVYPADALRVKLLEIPNGGDVYRCLHAYARERRTSLAVLHAAGSLTGSVSFVHTGPINTSGRLDIISLQGTILADEVGGAPSGLALVVSMGQMCEKGGIVNGAMVASGSVLVTVGSFSAPAVERLRFESPTAVFGPGPGFNRAYGNVNTNQPYGGGGHNGHIQYNHSFQGQQQNGGN